jgi:hypothetical protein
MAPRTHRQLIVWGFSIVYLAAMGSLVCVVNPFLENYRHAIIAFALLPLGLIGGACIAVAKLSPYETE